MVAHNWLWLSRGRHAARSPWAFRFARTIPCYRIILSISSYARFSTRVAEHRDIETSRQSRTRVSRVWECPCVGYNARAVCELSNGSRDRRVFARNRTRRKKVVTCTRGVVYRGGQPRIVNLHRAKYERQLVTSVVRVLSRATVNIYTSTNVTWWPRCSGDLWYCYSSSHGQLRVTLISSLATRRFSSCWVRHFC